LGVERKSCGGVAKLVIDHFDTRRNLQQRDLASNACFARRNFLL
jgi:hypothetical protein